MLSWYQGLSLRWKLRLPLLLLVVLILYMGMHSISTSKLLGGNAKDIAKINLPENSITNSGRSGLIPSLDRRARAVSSRCGLASRTSC